MLVYAGDLLLKTVQDNAAAFVVSAPVTLYSEFRRILTGHCLAKRNRSLGLPVSDRIYVTITYCLR